MNGEKENRKRKLNRVKKLKYILIIFLLINLSACNEKEPIIKPTPPLEISIQTKPENNCNSENLTTYIHAQQSGNNIDGSVVISNYLQNNCLITSPIKIELLTSDDKIISETIINDFSFELKHNDFLEIFFSWQNGCNLNETIYYSLSIMSNRIEGRNIAPLEDPNGNLFLNNPVCYDTNQGNQLQIIEIKGNSDN